MKKVLSTLLIVAVILGGIAIQTVQAASIKFSATPSTTTVDAGKTITVSLKISDINVEGAGINTLSTIFKYDESVFEDVKVSSKNNWSITYNDEKGNAQYGTLLAMLLSAGVKTDQEIGTISLKVKADAKGKTGNIYFTQIASNDGQNNIPVADKTIAIKVNGTSANNPNGLETSNPNGSDTNNPNGSGTNNPNGSDTNNPNGSGTNNSNGETSLNIIGSNGSSQKGQKENISTGKLPQTGYYETAIIVALVVGAFAIIVSYIKYQKYKETK